MAIFVGGCDWERGYRGERSSYDKETFSVRVSFAVGYRYLINDISSAVALFLVYGGTGVDWIFSAGIPTTANGQC